MQLNTKRILIIILMTSSVALLIALQSLWLLNCYDDEKDKFRRETSALFRSTLATMHDELIEKNIEAVPQDSVIAELEKLKPIHRHIQRFISRDTTLSGFPTGRLRVGTHTRKIEVYISSEADSVRDLLRPIATRTGNSNGASQKFVYRLGFDSLAIDSIVTKFGHALNETDIDVRFRVFKPEKPGKSQIRHDGDLIEIVRLDPGNEYGVSFYDVHTILIKAISPQILFCIILTLLTIGSFLLMYRSMRSQQKLMDIKNDFINNVTHELKTPLATMSVALEALRGFHVLDDPDKTKEYLDIARNEINRLTLMTDNILKTSSAITDGLMLRKGPVDLDDLIQKVLASLNVLFTTNKIKIKYEKKGTSFTMQGSGEHLSAVVYNLIDNAIKYRMENPSIEIVLEDLNEHLRLSISDNGIGIPSEFHTDVFEKFFRVPNGDVHNIKGYGLGLSYVAGIVKQHKGRISLQSEPGTGSTFILNLPK